MSCPPSFPLPHKSPLFPPRSIVASALSHAFPPPKCQREFTPTRTSTLNPVTTKSPNDHGSIAGIVQRIHLGHDREDQTEFKTETFQVSRRCSSFRHPSSSVFHSSQQLSAHQLHEEVTRPYIGFKKGTEKNFKLQGGLRDVPMQRQQ